MPIAPPDEKRTDFRSVRIRLFIGFAPLVACLVLMLIISLHVWTASFFWVWMLVATAINMPENYVGR
jgi:hypothetical protein